MGMLLTFLFSVLVIFFVENRYLCSKPIHIHYLCIILFSLYSIQIFNTLLCVVLLYWTVRSFKIPKVILHPYDSPLFFVSILLLFTGLLSVIISHKGWSLIGSLTRNFIVMSIWPIMISHTIKDINLLKKFAQYYAITRILEVGVIGIFIYFFCYSDFYIFNLTHDLGISFPELAKKRLVSIGAPNSNDAAFVLLGSIGLISYKLLNRIKFSDIFWCVIALIGIVLTWTRSVWPFLFLYFLITMFLRKKIKATYLFLVTIFFTIFLVFAFSIYNNRRSTDNRLQSNYNLVYRSQQILDYTKAIIKMPIFYGTYDDTKTIALRYNLKSQTTSSENYLLEIFTRHGILAGMITTLFFIYLLFSFFVTTKNYIKYNFHNKDDTSFVIAVFAIYISMFLMAQTTLFRNNLIFWIMIGFMSVIRQNIKKGYEI